MKLTSSNESKVRKIYIPNEFFGLYFSQESKIYEYSCSYYTNWRFLYIGYIFIFIGSRIFRTLSIVYRDHPSEYSFYHRCRLWAYHVCSCLGLNGHLLYLFYLSCPCSLSLSIIIFSLRVALLVWVALLVQLLLVDHFGLIAL